MEYAEALAYLDGTRWLGAEPSLRRIRELLLQIGDPQRELKFVHIAGTNGRSMQSQAASPVLCGLCSHRQPHVCCDSQESSPTPQFNASTSL